MILDDNALQILEEKCITLFNFELCCRVVLFFEESLYTLKEQVFYLVFSKANVASLHFSDTIIVLETVFCNYIFPYILTF